MFKTFVKNRCSWAFSELSRQNPDALLELCKPDMYHHFAGNHALGGERHSKKAFSKWLDRLFRLFPNIRFHVYDIIVEGAPWNTKAAIRWRDEAKAADGEPYVNEGIHVLQLQWGQLKSLDARLDTQVLEDTMQRMAEAGIEEAKAEPIED